MMLDILTNIITICSALGIFGALMARWIPNDKLNAWGLATGRFLNNFGKAKMGSVTWEKLEDFLVNSIGEYLRGVKVGLDEDE